MHIVDLKTLYSKYYSYIKFWVSCLHKYLQISIYLSLLITPTFYNNVKFIKFSNANIDQAHIVGKNEYKLGVLATVWKGGSVLEKLAEESACSETNWDTWWQSVGVRVPSECILLLLVWCLVWFGADCRCVTSVYCL